MDKFNQLHVGSFGIVADRLFVIFHERLLFQYLLGVELPHPSINHFFNNLFRLAFLTARLPRGFPVLFPPRAGSRSSLLTAPGFIAAMWHADILRHVTIASLDLQENALSHTRVVGIATAWCVQLGGSA